MINNLNHLNDLSITELIDEIILKYNISKNNHNGKYYDLCGNVHLNPNCAFIQKVKIEIDEWKNGGIVEIENKNYDEYICNQDSYDFFKTRNENEYEREYSNEYLKLIA